LKGKLVRLLSLGLIRTTTSTVTTATTAATATTTSNSRIIVTVSTTTAHHTRHVEPDRNRIACHKLMHSNVRRVAAGLAAAVRDKLAKEAAELSLESYNVQYSDEKIEKIRAARVQLRRAIRLGDLPSRALEAWLEIEGDLLTEEFFVFELSKDCKNQQAGLALAEEGARLGCHHCQGVMAECYRHGWGCQEDEARSLELARESSGKGSRYGQCMLGEFYQLGGGGFAQDYAQALALYRLAAAQNLDRAQCSLGCMYECGLGVAQDYAEALRLYQLAAAQGLSEALFSVALCHELGDGVSVDVEEARSWCRRAQAAGHHLAAHKLVEMLGSPSPPPI
jgi:TPR repeat protein